MSPNQVPPHWGIRFSYGSSRVAERSGATSDATRCWAAIKIFSQFGMQLGLPFFPFSDRLRVLRVMVVRIESQATTEAGLPDELILWNTLDECDESAVGVVPLSKYLRKG